MVGAPEGCVQPVGVTEAQVEPFFRHSPLCATALRMTVVAPLCSAITPRGISAVVRLAPRPSSVQVFATFVGSGFENTEPILAPLSSKVAMYTFEFVGSTKNPRQELVA